MSLLLIAALCAIASTCYHAQLITKIFAAPHSALQGWVDNMAGTRFYGVVEFITHSIRECAWCLAGQLALIQYLFCNVPSLSFSYLFGLIFQVTLAIYLTPIALKTLRHVTDEDQAP